MITTEEQNAMFVRVIQQISENLHTMMEVLWLHWAHLGVDDDTKISNIEKLVQIEKEHHDEVVLETKQKYAHLKTEVEKLKFEAEELSKCLSVDIRIPEYNQEIMLIDYKKQLEEEIAGYREQVENRRKNMYRLLEWQRDLSEKLGVTIEELQDSPLPSEEELARLNDRLEELQAERDKRVEIFLHTQVEIKDIMDKLQIKPQNKFEQMVVTSLSVDFEVSDLNMDRLAKLQQDLQEKYEQTNNRVLELRERLTKLWECLDEDQIYRENFLHAHPGCHPHTEAALKEEIRRCEQVKRQKIQVFVANMRTKIKLMWDNIMYSPRQREEFIHYYQDFFTEDTLTLHELYLERITTFYNENKEIFDLIVTRKNLWLKKIELEARASEPGRFHNRGGQLLREEKERKATENNLPKIEAQIEQLVLAYEARTGNKFTINGQPVMEVIAEEWESYKAERHSKVSARRAGAALTPQTPLPRSLATSPLGKRNRTAAGLPSTAEKRPSAKRQLITGSAKAVTAFGSNLSALKRSAITTVKRRISGRLAARVVAEGKPENAKRKLDYGGDGRKTPKVNGSILKHKRTSTGKRRSVGRKSNGSRDGHNNPLLETTLLTNYTAFKDTINAKMISRSSLMTGAAPPAVLVFPADEHPSATPKKTPIKAPMTPKIGKENMQHIFNTPKSNLQQTPTRLTRSALKVNDGFATPRAPLSASKGNLHRQHTVTSMPMKTTPNNVSRSKSHTHLARAKNISPHA